MRTLDDIIPPSRRPAPPTPSDTPQPSQRARGKFPMLFVFLVLVIIAGSVAALFYFKNTEAQVTPSGAAVPVSGTFLASTSGTDLTFEIISAQKVASQPVASSGSRAITSSAQGTITIYNTQTKSQPLIKNTRFATTGGLIFRIHSDITVPAAKGTTPGQISVTVYADKAGGEYNVAPSSFALPGLADTPAYTAVTAKSSTAMSGGASGNQPVVAASVESSARAALMTALAPDLELGLKAQIPADYVLLPGAATTMYQALPSTASNTNGMADVKEQGTITAIIFPKALLAEAIAKQALGGSYNGSGVLLGSDSLPTFSATSFPSTGDETVTFTLTGSASLVYSIDKNRIASAIAGKDRGQAETALRNFPEVKRAVLILRPFWRTTFPEDPTQITVTVEKSSDN